MSGPSTRGGPSSSMRGCFFGSGWPPRCVRRPRSFPCGWHDERWRRSSSSLAPVDSSDNLERAAVAEDEFALDVGPRAPAPALESREQVEVRVAPAHPAGARVRPVQSAADVPRAVAGGRPVLQVEIQRPQRSAAYQVVVERGIEGEVWREWVGELRAEEQVVDVEVVA